MSAPKPDGERCTPRTYSLTNAQQEWLTQRGKLGASALLREIVAREMARVARKEGK